MRIFCVFYLLVAPVIIIVISVIGVIAARAAIKVTTGKVKRDYQLDSESAANQYGFPTYHAWLVTQSFIVQWFAAW